MNVRDETIFKLGVAHAAAGQPRYKFQDPYLQQLYNRGYDDMGLVQQALTPKPKNRCRKCGDVIRSGETYCSACW